MIFATVGTHHQPFRRMLAALDEVDDELVVQYGYGVRPVRAARAQAFMPFRAMLTTMENARAVITHAGVGSVLCARAVGHTPVVVPRLARLGEHVDDHQSELARALEERGEVVVLWENVELGEALRRAGTRRERRELSATPLHGALLELIER